jgi:hypothetical protein
MTGECDGGLAGRLFGHKMRPRYSETSALPEWMGDMTRLRVRNPASAMNRTRTYEGDVCERCGYTVKPGGEP